jgi:UDP-N-acetylmuramate dehydrogenase
LVLVNLGGATGNDIRLLSDRIQQDVLGKFGVKITPEVNFI